MKEPSFEQAVAALGDNVYFKVLAARIRREAETLTATAVDTEAVNEHIRGQAAAMRRVAKWLEGRR